MNPTYNKRTYAFIPADKADQYIKSNLKTARFSSDESHIIWDQNWDPQTLEALKNDHDVKLMNHEAALALMSTPKWAKANE